MKAILVLFTVLLGFLLICATSAQVMKKGRPRGPPRFGKRSGGMVAPIHQRPLAFYRLYPDRLDDISFDL
ncbi:hypothetical protein FO519_002365 [Halicephalobus sp. NKZ332]|nr:hypothetical protein FO519_002365 [Halicephalobus sp. NKZ332]